MAPARRQTRDRTSSPYSGRPETRSRSVQPEDDNGPAATPKAAKKQQQDPSSRHRYGLRSMLSNLIWGSPVKAVQEATEDEEDDDDQEDDEQGQQEQHGEVQVISDDEDDDEDLEAQTASANPYDNAAARRFSAAEKGKGRPAAPPSNSKAIPRHASIQKSTFGNGLRSQTFGDLRSIQRDVGMDLDNLPTSTPNGSMSYDDEDENHHSQPPSSSADVNSQLANFFAAKGTASLTADERKKISEILLGGTASANSHVPTALTPNFSFSVPLPPTATANISILSPAYKGLPRSSTTASNLGGFSNRLSGGLTGSHSLSSLSTLAAAADGRTGPAAAAANPRSALNRRQARPLYLGAGYSSQAIARRKRAQAQINNLYSNLNSFDAAPTTTAAPNSIAPLATPGKRRRLGEEAETSMSVRIGSTTNNARPAQDLSNAPPAFSQQPASPFTSTPGPSRSATQPSLFQSAPHLKAQFGVTPVKPSPLRQAAAAMATPSPPPASSTRAEPSPPKSTSKTADLMRGIVGETAEPSNRSKATPASSTVERLPATPITMSRTKEHTTRVPRENLVKRTDAPSAAEILEKTMPPELRPTMNGKQARPKPPPVPGSARKTRAAAAAEAEDEKEAKRKAREQAKENLRVPAKKGKSRSKSPAVSESASGSATPAPAEHATSPPTRTNTSTGTGETTKLAAGKRTRVDSGESDQMQEEEAQAPVSTKAAFSFAAAPSTPAPSLFSSSAPPKPAQQAAAAPSKPLFAFNAPAQSASSSPIGSSNAFSVQSSSAAKPVAAELVAGVTGVASKSSTPEPPSSTRKDPKAEALKVPTVSLPTFTLYDFDFKLSELSSDDDAKITAIKQAVLEIPAKELVTYDLM